MPFDALVSALTERFRRLRDDGLVGRVDTIASARALLAAVHSAAIFETMAHGGPHHGHGRHVDALVEVLWTCGDAICPAGEVCCNASCGICVPPGYGCIQIACVPG